MLQTTDTHKLSNKEDSKGPLNLIEKRKQNRHHGWTVVGVRDTELEKGWG